MRTNAYCGQAQIEVKSPGERNDRVTTKQVLVCWHTRWCQICDSIFRLPGEEKKKKKKKENHSALVHASKRSEKNKHNKRTLPCSGQPFEAKLLITCHKPSGCCRHFSSKLCVPFPLLPTTPRFHSNTRSLPSSGGVAQFEGGGPWTQQPRSHLLRCIVV